MLGLALTAQVTVSIVTQGVPTLAPFLQADLALTRGQVGLFNSALMGGSFIALFFAGAMVDLRGERLALGAGNIVVGVACIAILATHGFLTALGMFFLAGIGASFATPAGSRTVMRWFPPQQRGSAMGVRQTGIPIGGALAAALLPLIALGAGWRWAIALSGLASVLAGALCLLRYPAPSSEEDVAARSVPPQSFRTLLTRDVALLGLAGAFLPLGQFALVTYLALYLLETQDVPVTHTAVLLVAAQIAGAAGRVLWGVISDRFMRGRRKPALIMAGGFSALGAQLLVVQID